MKTSIRIIALLVLTMASVSVVSAASRVEFDQLVQQLQAKPGDGALRERIIKASQELKPAPAIPEEARRSFARKHEGGKH